MKILYLEDNPSDIDLTRREIAKIAPDIDLEIVNNLDEARGKLFQAEAGRYDVLLSDLRLPDGTGLELLAEIREAALQIAVVIVTSGGDEDAAVAALKAGADDYIVKRADYLKHLPFTLANAYQQNKVKSNTISRPLRILYAEHNLVDIDLTTRHLQRKAPYFHLEVAHSGPKVLETLKAPNQKAFDLLLLDYRLPGESGLEVLKELRINNIDIPVIMVTGQGDEEVALQAIRLGAADYVIKNTGYLHQLPYAIENVIKSVERERQQTALRESQARLQALFDNAQDAFLLLNDACEIVDANRTATKILGYSQSELVKMKNADLLPADQKPSHVTRMQTLLQEGILETESQLVKKDGTVIFVEIRSVANIIPGIHLSVIHDITSRRKAEEQVRKLSRAVDQSPVAVLITDTTGCVEYANPFFSDLTGFAFQEIEGKSITEFLGITDPIETLFSRQDKGKSALERLVIGKTGESFWLSIVVSPIYDGTEIISNYVVICQNITERIQAIQQIKKESDRAQSMARTAARLNEELDQTNILRIIREEMKAAAGIDDVIIFTWDENQKTFTTPDPTAAHKKLTQAVFTALHTVSGLMKSSQPYFLTNRGAWLPGLSPADCRDEITVLKMVRGNQLISMVVAFSETPLSEDTIALITDLSNEGAQAILNAQLFENVKKRLHQVQALNRIENTISSSTDTRLVLNTIVEEAISLLDVDAMDVFLLDETSFTLAFSEGKGFNYGRNKQLKVRLGEGLAGKVALQRETTIVPDLRSHSMSPDDAELTSVERLISYIGVPIIAKGRLRGVIQAYNRSKFNPDQEWLDLINSLAKQAAVALENLSLFENLERSNFQLLMAYDTTIEGWSRALDLRDKETEGHTQRVTTLTLQLAKLIGVDDNELVHMRRGALLHDIGKMGVPDQILLKPGPLNAEEWDIMRRHPSYAYELLLPIQFLKPALDIPYCHHEKWDGSGYPRGLSGESIPIAARIFAVIDVWDALSSDRPYRSAWPEPKVLDYIEENSGSHFDPNVVRAFKNLVKNNGFKSH
ncbi:MAG: PAS domain S-box protein [Chloroflexi bacterium]|nr:PAS domain S-box protein [Chloroflexota bacterium]